jgi:hypothetical protein
MHSDDRQERVIYEPPKSAGFGHQARKRNAWSAWTMTETFLEIFTIHSPAKDIQLTCCGPSEWTDRAAAAESIMAARRLWGPEDETALADKIWNLNPEQLPSAIPFVIDHCKRLRQAIGPVQLTFNFDFVWRDLLEKPLPAGEMFSEENWREGNDSLLGVSLEHSLFLQPRIIFPFPWDSPELAAFLAKIEDAAPFRFREQSFNRIVPSKTGVSYRKLPKGWRQHERKSNAAERG